MVAWTKRIAEIFRDYQTDGVPSSGVQKVVKPDMRVWGKAIEDTLDAMPAAADILEAGDIPALIQTYNQGNASTARTDLRIMLMVKSALTYAPPGSPSSGDMYIVPTGATGAWASNVGKVALYSGGVWTYWTPSDGWSAFAKDSSILYIYATSAWAQASSSVVSVTSSLVQVSLLGKPTTPGGGKVKTWLTANNDVFAAGDNTNVQNGYQVGATDLPVKITFNTTPGTITKIVQSCTSTYILDNTGKVWSLGGNAAGQLGHGDTSTRTLATRIEYFVSNSLAVTDIFASGDAAGTADYVFFLTTGGTVYACGANTTGQLGLGDTTQRTTPTLVTAVSSVARVICSGNTNAHTLLITTGGALWTTGYNGAGQLGQGDTTQRTTFTAVSGFTNASKGAASAVSAPAAGNSYVLKTDGTVWAAGYNAYGQLGQGDTTTRNAFTQISSLSSITDVQATSDYFATVAALKSDGTVYIWGYNGAGCCGTGNTTNQTSPQAPSFSAQGTIAQVVVAGASSAGQTVYCRTSGGSVWSAGYSTNGNTGANSGVSALSSFTQAPGLDGVVTDLSVTGVGVNFGPSVLYSDGRTATAGDNSKGQLGLGTGTANALIFKQVSAITPRGVKGDAGAAGADGATAGVGFNFSTTTTDADPGSGNLRLNNVTASSATAVYIDNANRSGSDSTTWLDTFDDNGSSGARGVLQIFDPSAPDTTFRFYLVTGSVVDGTGYRKLTLSHIGGAGTFSNAQHVRVSFTPAGANGSAGPTLAIGFNYSTTTTDSDPGSGNFRLNNSTLASATAAYFDNNNRGGVDVSGWLDTFDDSGTSGQRGALLLTDPANSATNFRIYSVTGSVVDGTGYRKVTVAHVAGGGSFTNGAEVSAWFVPRGATGSGDLSSVNNLTDVASAATAFANIKQAATTTATGVAELATDAEAIAKSDTARVITPSNLAALGASDTFAGLVELATTAETLTGTDTARAVTPAGVKAVWDAILNGVSASFDTLAEIATALGTKVALAGNQTLTGGFSATSYSIGSVTGSNQTITPAAANGNFQHCTLNGSSLTGTLTFAAPSTVCSIIVEVVNGGSGSVGATLSTSGFDKVTGDSYATTNGSKFNFMIVRTNSYKHLHIQALQ